MKPDQRRRRFLALFGSAVAIFLAFTLPPAIRSYRASYYLTETVTCMKYLMDALAVQTPPATPAGLRSAAESLVSARCLEDRWGHPFEIEPAPGVEPPYRLRSLGRDGQRGPCCRRNVDGWDEDAVLEGDTWLQVWKDSH